MRCSVRASPRDSLTFVLTLGHPGTASVFAVIVLGLAADWISVTETDLGYYFAYVALAIATAVLTIVTVPAMYVWPFDPPTPLFDRIPGW